MKQNNILFWQQFLAKGPFELSGWSVYLQQDNLILYNHQKIREPLRFYLNNGIVFETPSAVRINNLY